MLAVLFLLLLEMPALADSYLTCNISILLGQIRLASNVPPLSDSRTEADFPERTGDVSESTEVSEPEKVEVPEEIIGIDGDDSDEDVITEQPKDEEITPEVSINSNSPKIEEGSDEAGTEIPQ